MTNNFPLGVGVHVTPPAASHIAQAESTSGPHVTFGNAGDSFAIGSNLIKKRKLNERNSRQDSEGIVLLRQIFPDEPDHELHNIHTAHLQTRSSNEAAHRSHDELQAMETNARIEKESARRWQSRRERMAYADNAVRADNEDVDDDGTVNCRKTKKCHKRVVIDDSDSSSDTSLDL